MLGSKYGIRLCLQKGFSAGWTLCNENMIVAVELELSEINQTFAQISVKHIRIKWEKNTIYLEKFHQSVDTSFSVLKMVCRSWVTFWSVAKAAIICNHLMSIERKHIKKTFYILIIQEDDSYPWKGLA